ncbi:MAG: LysM peptidoglycan-binding domain-containing protein [Spirosomataceae bacterium]
MKKPFTFLFFYLIIFHSFGQKGPTISHRVQKGETVYSLIKRYNCSMDEFSKLNPTINLSQPILSLDQTLLFPTSDQVPTQEANVHVVKEKETLYSIARLYGIPMARLQTWNKLPDEQIQIGQVLVLMAPKDTLPSEFQVEKKDLHAIPVTEVGIAEVIKSKVTTDKHLALHRSASVGTLVKVRNEATGASVLVKVIGQLPDTGENHGVLIRVSPAAFRKLQPRDARLRAEVSYVIYPTE